MLFLLSLRFGQISPLAFFRWFLPRPRIGMLSLVTVSPVITAFHSCCLSWIVPLTLDPMLRVKQGGIKYHFLSLWYDSTWDWTPVFRTNSKHSNDYAKGLVFYSLYGFNFSSDLKFRMNSQALRDHFKGSNYKWYHCHFHVSQPFHLSGKIQVFIYPLVFFYFHSVETAKSSR